MTFPREDYSATLDSLAGEEGLDGEGLASPSLRTPPSWCFVGSKYTVTYIHSEPWKTWQFILDYNFG